MPYEEYRQWKLFYLLEPWGFQEREYQFALLLAKINNVHATKKSQTVKPIAYIRDMGKELLKYFKKEIEQDEIALLLDTEEGQEKASEHMIKTFEQMFGVKRQKK